MDRWTDEWHRLLFFFARPPDGFEWSSMSNVFFVFASVGFQSFSGHRITTQPTSRPNERERSEQRAFTPALPRWPPCQIALASLSAVPSSMIGLLYIVGNKRIARGGGAARRQAGPDTVTMTM